MARLGLCNTSILIELMKSMDCIHLQNELFWRVENGFIHILCTWMWMARILGSHGNLKLSICMLLPHYGGFRFEFLTCWLNTLRSFLRDIHGSYKASNDLASDTSDYYFSIYIWSSKSLIPDSTGWH